MDSTKVSTSSHTGYYFTATAAILWAVSGAAAKYLFQNGVTPFQLVQMRLTIAVAGLFLFLLVRHPSLLRIARSDILYFAIYGCMGMAGVQFTYLFAISKIHVAAAILLQYLGPGLIALHAVVFFRDRLKPVTVMALVGSLSGCYLVVGAYNLDALALNLLGIISGLMSAVTFAWYSIQGEYGMRKYSPWTVLFYAMLFGALTWNVLYPPLEGFRHAWPPVVWGWIMFIGILGTLIPFGFYLEGINLIRATRASITATLEPITAGVLSFLFLNEIMEFWQVMGAVLVIFSVVMLQLNQERDQKAPAIMRMQQNPRQP